MPDSCEDTCCGPSSSAPFITPERAALIQAAFRLEWLTVAWMVVEGAVAIAAGVNRRESNADGLRT